jgi:hypothetical protein
MELLTLIGNKQKARLPKTNHLAVQMDIRNEENCLGGGDSRIRHSLQREATLHNMQSCKYYRARLHVGRHGSRARRRVVYRGGTRREISSAEEDLVLEGTWSWQAKCVSVLGVVAETSWSSNKCVPHTRCFWNIVRWFQSVFSAVYAIALTCVFSLPVSKCTSRLPLKCLYNMYTCFLLSMSMWKSSCLSSLQSLYFYCLNRQTNRLTD